MRAHNQAYLIAALALAGQLLAGCSACQEDRAWEALLPAMPARVSPELAGVNTALYILKQTHEPLFRKDDGQSFQSRVLRDWSRAVDSTAFTFCPDTSLMFDEGHAFTAQGFQAHVEAATRRFDPSARLSQAGDCVKVGFRRGRKDYLDFLAMYENAPSLKTPDPKVEAGLGPFKVESISPENIVLVRKKPVRAGYNSVVLRFYRGPGDPGLQSRRIADFNRIPTADVPAWVAQEYQSFGNTLLKSYNLIINHPDPAVRKAVYGCMDVDGLRRAYFPANREFHDLKNILPVGVPGGQAGRPEQACPATPGQAPAPLVFVDWRTDNGKPLREFVAVFTRRTGIPVRIKELTLSALADVALKRPHPYNLAVVALDAVRPDHSAFLDYVLKKDGLIDFDLPRAKALYARMARADDPAERTALVSRIVDDMADEAAVLPLFQDIRRFYYPKEVKNLVIGKGFLEYPEVGELRL
jgi:ABC-type transport system substrate-binding protein